jgi:hypothetical protein
MGMSFELLSHNMVFSPAQEVDVSALSSRAVHS